MNWEVKVFFETIRWMLIPLVMGGIVSMQIWQSLEYNNIQRQIQRVQSEKESTIRKNEDLRIAILTQTSVERLDNLFIKNIQDTYKGEKRKITTLSLPPIGTQDEKLGPP